MRHSITALILGGIAVTSSLGQVPRPSPNLEIEMPGGKTLALESLRGKVVLAAFLSTT